MIGQVFRRMRSSAIWRYSLGIWGTQRETSARTGGNEVKIRSGYPSIQVWSCSWL